jgi:hypothetical protein
MIPAKKYIIIIIIILKYPDIKFKKKIPVFEMIPAKKYSLKSSPTFFSLKMTKIYKKFVSLFCRIE